MSRVETRAHPRGGGEGEGESSRAADPLPTKPPKSRNLKNAFRTHDDIKGLRGLPFSRIQTQKSADD
jgi:hypothetical protein